MKAPHLAVPFRGLTIALLCTGLTGCGSVYYNAQYIDNASAQINFQRDNMRCRAYSNGQTPMPASHQVQNYDYVVNGTAQTTPTFGGYNTTYNAQVTAVPSTADALMSATTSLLQVATLIHRSNLYEDCMKNLGWTKNKKEAFPDEDLILEAPDTTADFISPTFYTPLEHDKKINLTVNLEPVAIADLAFKNNGNTYTLNVNGFNQALQAELGAHFARVAHTPEEKAKAEIQAKQGVRFVINPLSLDYSGVVVVEFYNSTGILIRTVRHETRGRLPIDSNKLDKRAKILTEFALTELIRNAGWKMTTSEFILSFPAGTIQAKKTSAPVAKKVRQSVGNKVEEALANHPKYKKELTSCLCSRTYKGLALMLNFATEVDKKPFDYDLAASFAIMSYLAGLEGSNAPQEIKDLATKLPVPQAQQVCENYIHTMEHSKEYAKMQADSVYAKKVLKQELITLYGPERAQTTLEKIGDLSKYLK